MCRLSEALHLELCDDVRPTFVRVPRNPDRIQQPGAYPLVCQSLGVCVESPLHVQPLMSCTRLRKECAWHQAASTSASSFYTPVDSEGPLESQAKSPEQRRVQTARTGSVCSPKPTSDPCPAHQRQPATPSGPRLAVAQQRLSSRTRELSARSTSSRVQRKSRQRHRCQPIASATATRSSLHSKRSLRASRSVLKSSLSTDPPDEGSAKRTRRPKRRKAETTETAVSVLTHWQRWKIEQNTKQPPYTTNKLTKLLAALVIPTTLKSRTAYG